MAKMYANVWATGRLTVIRWPGGMCIAEGAEHALRKHFGAVCRRAYRPGVLLVPGVPEAKDQKEALKSLKLFVDWSSGTRVQFQAKTPARERTAPKGVTYRPPADWDAGDAKGPGSKGRAS